MNGTLFAIQVSDDDLKVLRVRRENGSSLASPIHHARFTEREEQTGNAGARERLASFMEEIQEERPPALIVLNSQDLDYLDFSFPFEAERKVRNAIEFELSTNYPPEGYIHDHVKSMGREAGYHAYITAVVPRSILTGRIRTVEGAGFRVLGVTSDVSTLGAVFREEEEALVMDTGEQHTLFALYRQGVPVLLRKIPIGMRSMQRDPGSGGAAGLAQLGAEIKRTIHSFNSKLGLELDRLYVTGNLPLHEGSLEALKQQARTEIVLKPLSEYSIPVEEPPDSADPNVFAPVIGSVFWRRKNGFFNFLKDAFAREEESTVSLRRALRWGWGFVGAFLLILSLSYVLDLIALRERHEFLKSEIRSTFTSAFPQVNRIQDEVKQARNLLNAEQSALAGGNPAGNASLISALRTISVTIPENVPFQIVSLFWETGKIEIYARTDTFKTVNAVQELLAGSKDIAQATISNARHREEGQDVEFKLSIRLAG